MTVRFRLPDLGEGVAETEIVRWLVRQGETVSEDQPMVEVATDKANVEIPAPASGEVLGIFVQAGETVPVGTVLVEIGEPGTQPSHTPDDNGSTQRATAPGGSPGAPSAGREPRAPGAQPASTQRVRATPLVRKLAAERGVDLAGLEGTGPGGRITEADVERAAGGVAAPAGAAPVAAVQPLLLVDEVVTNGSAFVTLGQLADAVVVELTATTWVDAGVAQVAVAADSTAVDLPVTTRDGAQRSLSISLAGEQEAPLVASLALAAGSAGAVRLHRPVERAVVQDGQLAIAPVAYVTLTVDAALVDQATASTFLYGVARRLG